MLEKLECLAGNANSGWRSEGDTVELKARDSCLLVLCEYPIRDNLHELFNINLAYSSDATAPPAECPVRMTFVCLPAVSIAVRCSSTAASEARALATKPEWA
jgi:hypothetical protein